MAKKVVASLQKGGGKEHTKVIKMVKSDKTGSFAKSGSLSNLLFSRYCITPTFVRIVGVFHLVEKVFCLSSEV
jgi:hypothetical protein